jgi:hypothetical protein
MNKDGVVAAFELIVGEIEAVASEIAEQGSKAFKEKTYDVAQQLSESGKSLEAFRARVDALLQDWHSGIDVPTRQRFTTPRFQIRTPKAGSQPRPARTSERAPRTHLRVTLNDGTVFEEHQAADTFALVLSRIGLARVEALGITVRTLPLVGNSKSSSPYGQTKIEGKYICTHSSTKEKKETLELIGKKLETPLRVQIIENN